MKKYVSLTSLLLSFFVLFISCESDDSEDNTILSTIYLEDTFAEIYILNGLSATPHTQGVTTNQANNIIDISDFSGLNLTGFSTRAAAPIEDGVFIDGSLGSVVIVLKDGTQVPPFYESGNVGSIIDFDGISRLNFEFNFSYPTNANPILIDDIQQIRLVYNFIYSQSSEIINEKTFTHTINFEGGNSSGGSNCAQEIQSVNFTNITYGDACGSPTSIRLFYTNTLNYSIRVRFTVVDEDGEWSGENLGFILDPGETTNQHFCTPKIVNNQFCYQILIKDVNSDCEFPDVVDIPLCSGF